MIKSTLPMLSLLLTSILLTLHLTVSVCYARLKLNGQTGGRVYGSGKFTWLAEKEIIGLQK